MKSSDSQFIFVVLFVILLAAMSLLAAKGMVDLLK